MTYLAPLLAGLILGTIVGSSVLHWVVGLAQVIGSRSGKRNGEVIRNALIVTVASSGFWILLVVGYAAYQIFSRPLDKPWIVGFVGFLASIALLCWIAYGFARGGSGSLLMRFAQSMRRKESFMRFGFAVDFIVTAPMLYDWYEQGLSAGFLIFVAVL